MYNPESKELFLPSSSLLASQSYWLDSKFHRIRSGSDRIRAESAAQIYKILAVADWQFCRKTFEFPSIMQHLVKSKPTHILF